MNTFCTVQYLSNILMNFYSIEYILECFGLKVLLERLVDKLNISVVTTDRSGPIKALMK